MEDIFSSLAKKIYELFVVNPYAVAIQQDDAKYVTKYVPYDYLLLKGMLERKGAAGCYQQGFKNGLIKWVCLDFDCKDKRNPQIRLLYSEIASKVLKYLDALNISYLTEFSGRRGIHVWILFASVFSKAVGFEIVNHISNMFELDNRLFGLDIFPATDSSKGNKVGKQVKFPLSCHKDGSQSFLFTGVPDFECIYREDFYEQQYKLLSQYQVNDINLVTEKLGIPMLDNWTTNIKYKKYSVLDNIFCKVCDIEQILGGTKVFDNIFKRLRAGCPMQKDWFVLLGTLGSIDKEGEILNSLFSSSPAYDEEITGKNILMWKNKYYPATFLYLYKIYGLEMELDINPSQTGLEYLVEGLCEKYGKSIKYELIVQQTNEKIFLQDIRKTAIKEKHYLLTNDENIVISVWNALNNLTEYDYIRMDKIVNQIIQGEIKTLDKKEFYKFFREENEEKQRELVVLGVYDRIITTHLAMILAYNNSCLINSFSYNVAFLSEDEIFYNWYTSWGNYIDKIKVFLEIPYLDNWGIIVLDIKKFYDSINFLTIYNIMKDNLNKEDKRIFEFLIRYNEELMRELTNNRIGVPQGPAYARIVSEMFLDQILKTLSKNEIENYHYILYRYVDDIIVFYDPTVDGNKLYNKIYNLLVNNGLEINAEKSKLYGKIAALSEKKRNQILRKEKFNYMLQDSDFNALLTGEEKSEIYENCISDKFKIDDVAFIFSKKTSEFYMYKYFHRNKREIFASIYGRGSIFLRFYQFVLSNRRFLAEAIETGCFGYIPTKSLNFKNCISSIYYVVQKKNIDIDLFELLCDTFLRKIDLAEIDEGDRITIKSLLRWEKDNV